MKDAFIEKLTYPITDEVVMKVCFAENGNIRTILRKRIETDAYKPIKAYLLTRYSDIPEDMFSFKEVLWRIKNHMETRPVCEHCGKPVRFHGKTWRWKDVHGNFVYGNGFDITCSKECNHAITYEKCTDTMMKEYNVQNNFQRQSSIDKLNDVRSNTKEWLKKRDETNLKKYGVTSTILLEDVRKKAKRNFAKTASKQSKNYQMIVNLLNDPNVTIESLEENPEYDEALKDYNSMLTRIYRIDQAYENNDFHSRSKQEDDLYEIISREFEGVKRNYRDKERYNYRCDFYIPSLDLFIEYQGSKFHNKYAYNPESEAHRLELEELSRRAEVRGNTGAYPKIISVWTKSDPEKRRVAEENNLRYLEIYPYYSFDDVVPLIRNTYYEGSDARHVLVGEHDSYTQIHASTEQQ